jgi:PAS domain-containing protein
MQDRSELAEPVLEQLADAIICADRSGANIRWNRASAALFGYASDEALGQRGGVAAWVLARCIPRDDDRWPFRVVTLIFFGLWHARAFVLALHDYVCHHD